MEPVKNSHPFKVGDRIRVKECGLAHVPASAAITGEVLWVHRDLVRVRLDEVVKNVAGDWSRDWYSSSPNEQLTLITNTPREASTGGLVARNIIEEPSPVSKQTWAGPFPLRLHKNLPPALPKLLLDEAKDILAERGGTYGAAEDSFASIAQAWSAYLDNKPKNSRIAPLDVAMMMTILKCIREAQNHKWDNLVDIAGYAQNAACIAKPSQREAMR